jgi:drug/metabolite transporter (DMT)-like permease
VAGTAALLAGVALLAGARDGGGVRMGRPALVLGVASALAFGTYFLVVDVAVGGGASPLWVAGLVTVGSAVAAAAVLLRRGRASALRLPRVARGRLLAVGAFLAVADLALAAAMATGDVALVSVIASSDPALTVVAARLVLAERISARQALGLGVTLAGLLGVAAA